MKENKMYALKLSGKAALAVVSLALWAGHAEAGSVLITSLHNTGAGLSNGNVDSHWTVGVTPNTAGQAFAVTTSAPANWTPGENINGGSSNWISPVLNAGPAQLNTNYTYRTTFDLTGSKLNWVDIQGRWASDNKLQSIILNAGTVNQATISTNALGNLFNSVTSQPNWNINPADKTFSLAAFNGFYVAGINTLDFVVNNAGTSASDNGATGLRVQFTTAYVPEPASLALLGLGMAGLGAMRRRKV